MSAIDALIVLLEDFSVGVMLVIAAKTLFEKTVVFDWIAVLLVLGGAVWSTIISCVQGVSDWYIWNVILYAELIFIGVTFIRGGTDGRLRRICSLFNVFITEVSIFASIDTLFVLINPSIAGKESFYEELATDFVILIISLYLYRELLKKGICLNFNKKEKVLMYLFFVVVICMMGIMEEMVKSSKYLQIPVFFRYFTTVCFAGIYVGVPLLMIKNKLYLYFEWKQKYQQEILELELKHFEQYKEAQEATKRFRHDMMNNLMTLQILQKEGKMEEASNYLADLLGEVQMLSPKVVTGNDMLDCIVSSKLDIMEQLHIDWKIEGILGEGLHIKPIDICAIFANAIDNAIEACEKVSGKRRFELKIRRTKMYHCVTIENSIPKGVVLTDLQKDGHFTTKSNQELHGYGFDNIKSTIKRYNGEYSVELKEDAFVLTILLPVI